MSRGAFLVLASVVATSLALIACSKDDEETADLSSAYKRDVERLCNAQERAGAEQLDPGHRPVAIAQWLAENLETDEVRELLGEFRAGSPAEKRALLEREARAVGLSDCPLIDAWSQE